jgi:peptidoglycan hydrolase CwlO-like protein
MKKRFIIAVLTAGVVMMCLTGCKEKPAADPESEIVKTDAEYKEQAEKEITKENMQEELDKLEKTVDEDLEM